MKHPSQVLRNRPPTPKNRFRNRLWFLAALGPLLFSARSAVSSEALIPEVIRESVEAAVAKVKPSLVRVHVVSAHYSDGREVKSESTGSGAIITPEGHVITNHHVAGHATRLFCTLATKEEMEAKLVGTDPLSDISVIKLLPQDTRKFLTVSFGDSASVHVGDHVLAMGSPMALSQSVTLGIVSNTEMVMPKFFGPFSQFLLDGEDVGSMVLWIGHDADIYGGNSGGPLVNLDGEIVGINEMRMGLAGAIPGNLAREVAEELIKTGRVRRAWIGLEVQPRLKHSEPGKGVLVSGTIEGSPADSAGFQSGDVLMKLGEAEFDIRFPEEIPIFNRTISDLPLEDEAEAVIIRDGKETILKVRPIEREEVLPKEQDFKQWGITARNLSFVLAKKMKREAKTGALITSVRTGGPSGEAKPSLYSGDIILSVSGTPVNSLESLARITDHITQGNEDPTPTMVEFERKRKKYLTVVEVGIRELQDPGLEVKKAWLPVDTQVLTKELAEQMGLENKSGVRVTHVYNHDSLNEVDLRVGDLILEVDGEEIEASEPQDYEVFPTMIRQYKVGAEVELTVWRGGDLKKVVVQLARAPKLVREMKRYEDDDFEFTVRELAFFDKASEGWEEDQTGALVAEVKSGGWAALGDLLVDDLILKVNDEPVGNLEDIKRIMEKIGQEKPKSAVFFVRRSIHHLFLEMQPTWEKEDS